MLKTTQEQYLETLRLSKEFLDNFWKTLCEADHKLLLWAGTTKDFSDESFEQERDSIKLLFQHFVKASHFVESLVKAWPTLDEKSSQQINAEMKEIESRRKQTESYLISGFVKITPEQKLEFQKNYEEFKKIFKEIFD